MPVNPLSLQPQLPPADAGASAPKRELEEEDFLSLMMAQMQNQDPLNPMDSANFMDQVTSLNTVKQLMDANERLDKLMLGMTSLNNENAVNLVGREVVAYGDRFQREAGQPEELSFELAGEATDVIVTVFDENGRVVDAIEAGGRPGGQSSVSWDGRDLAGVETEEGTYHFEVTARDANGDLVESSTFVSGRVEELRFVDGVPVLWVEGQNVGLEAIIRVMEGEPSGAPSPPVDAAQASTEEAEAAALESQWTLDSIAMNMGS